MTKKQFLASDPEGITLESLMFGILDDYDSNDDDDHYSEIIAYVDDELAHVFYVVQGDNWGYPELRLYRTLEEAEAKADEVLASGVGVNIIHEGRIISSRVPQKGMDEEGEEDYRSYSFKDAPALSFYDSVDVKEAVEKCLRTGRGEVEDYTRFTGYVIVLKRNFRFEVECFCLTDGSMAYGYSVYVREVC